MPPSDTVQLPPHHSVRSGNRQKYSAADDQKGDALVDIENVRQVRSSGSGRCPCRCRCNRKLIINYRLITDSKTQNARNITPWGSPAKGVGVLKLARVQIPASPLKPVIRNGLRVFCCLLLEPSQNLSKLIHYRLTTVTASSPFSSYYRHHYRHIGIKKAPRRNPGLC